MVFEPDEKLKKKMDKDGSVLKYMHGAAGAGKGLYACGGMFAAIGVLFVFALKAIDLQMALITGGACVILGLLMVVGGMALQNRRESRWAETYCRKTGFSEEELRKVDAEFKQPGTILFALEKGKDNSSLKKMGFITDHYIRFAGIHPALARLEDLVACFYTKKFLCKDGGYDKALIAYSRDQKLSVMFTGPNEKAAQEIVDIIVKCNPMVISHHHFQYGDRTYDAVKDMEEVIQLHDQIRAERAAAGR